ncbi:MAG TPA: hypothetical protein DEB55_17875 [Microbacterium sp.]|uniref:hypothetical protein n=1 Tax=Microbacterium sp. UBA1612 TaxID=1946942 RepID=UPI000E95946A|nr:hypothetical protein [Microbacterium sp. UBA1612]HBS76227.1 hypothetical protein [Microbacterium sp.]|tara:strand:+ start:365 stop:544 length:180 start_codon:yes stop_codon:yes gene_type:complete
MSPTLTPAELARELSVPAKRIRSYLRSEYGRLKFPETRWHLDAAQANDVRDHFSTPRPR